MARKSGFVRRNNAMRRDTIWLFGGPGQFVIASASTAVVLASFNAAALALRPFTVVRTRGQFLYHSDQRAATEDYEGAFGLAVVSDQASAIGVTAVPTPITDMGSDLWFVYEMAMGLITVTTDVGVVDPAGRLLNFDSKAMRKVEDGSDVVMVGETTGTSEGWAGTFAFRMLLKLH